MNKTKSKSKALKNNQNQAGVLRALIVGFAVCLVSWLLLSLVFSFVMSKQTDSTALIKVFAPITAVVSLIFGGFAAGFSDKTAALLTPFILGCAVLGICYALSAYLDLSYELGTFAKTAVIAAALVCPVIGARFSRGNTSKKHKHRK